MTKTDTAGLRPVHLASMADLDMELGLIQSAHVAGKLGHAGNYSPGQTMHHLARWAERYIQRDFPKIPWFMKPAGRLLKPGMLRNGFRPGLPGPTGKSQPEPDVPFEDGLSFLRRMNSSIEAKDADIGHVNPFLGRLTHDECVRIHLRHCELHLGFLTIDP